MAAESSAGGSGSVRRDLTVGGMAFAVLLAAVALLKAVWSLDEHFITRREVNDALAVIHSDLDRIHAELRDQGKADPPAKR